MDYVAFTQPIKGLGLISLFVLAQISFSHQTSAQSVTASFQDGVNGYSGTRDTKLTVNPSKKNYGSDAVLDVDGRPDRSALLYWDVTDIPVGVTIESVDITFNVITGAGQGYEVYALQRDWVENEATWDEYASGQNWQTGGADGANDRSSEVLASILAPSAGTHTFSLNDGGIAAVQSWVDSPTSNHGLIVLDYLDATDGLQFSSREAGIVSERPRLTVTYNTGNLSLVTIDDVSVTEGDGGAVASFTVSLSLPNTGQTVTVDYATSAGTAAEGVDYTASSGQVIFDPGVTSQTVTVPIAGDALDEEDETFFVDLSNAENAVISDGQGQATIVNDDPAPSISITDASADEGASVMSFAVSLSVASGRDVVVDFATADGTALAGDDYIAAAGALTISAGSLSGSIEVTLVDDAANENTESFSVNLSNPVNASISDGQAQGTITDADPLPILSIDDVTASEGIGDMTFTVTLSAVSGLDVSVDFSTTDGTATSPADYTPATGTLIIPAGAGSGTILVTLIDDTEEESPEDFTVNLSNATNATLADGQGIGTIVDNEGLPALTIDDVTVVEGDSETIDAVFTVTLSPAAAGEVRVDYATSDGTAEADDDYVAISGQLIFSAGETSQSVAVSVNGDVLDEVDETFSVILSNEVNAGISDNQGQGTITDDDPTPSLSINDVTADEDAGAISFTVTLSAISGKDVTVDYMTADDTAIAPGDYTAVSGTLIIPAGTGAGTITFGNIGDYGDGSDAEASVASMLLALNPDIITTNGDNNYPDGEEATWAENVLQFYGSYVDAFDVNANRFFASLGNHDYHVFPSAFLNGLALPEGQGNERYYDFVKGPIHFFAIDSNDEQPDGRSSTSIQGQWLQARLAESTSPWNIVYMHHAPWSSGSNHGNSSTMQWPYDAWGADAVFAAHDHTYERISKDEDGDGDPILYFVNGLGGNGIYNFGSPISGSQFRYNNDHGAMFVRANAESITYEFYSVSEGLVDQFTVTKSGQPVATLTVDAPIIDDTEIEIAETFTVILSNPVNATLADAQGTGTIADNDAVEITISFQDGVNGYNGTQDTKLLAGTPGGNFGSTGDLEIDGSPDKSALLSWDLTEIPTGSVIESVQITVNVIDRSGDSYEMYEMLRPWKEMEATWDQFAFGQSWETAGGDGNLDRGSTILGAFIGSSRGVYTTSLNADGVDVVQAWVDDPSTNNGFIILDYDGASNGLDFPSRDASAVSDHPVLTVTYTNAGQAGGASASVSERGGATLNTEQMPANVASTESSAELPQRVALNPNYPNPFNLETSIEYALPEQARVRLAIFNVMGQMVRVLVDELQEGGFKTARWNGRDDAGRELGSGVYFARLAVDHQSFVQTMVLQK